ncbi:PQQ-binding-like beta-propeller repeat protein [Microlunatus speluncae]|uniref:PQQ-binding-like beta-propeller repeat protein n=1 Tax=Microlunatus speluncae TaxID=2594267 RepID=UPI001266772C|nr:PQQ-binding-like beta-propeller repeat protein [Microlunatus speluncae]
MRSQPRWSDLNRTFPLPLTEIADVPGPESFRLVDPSGPAFMISCPDSSAGRAAGVRLADRIDLAARTAGLAGLAVAPVPSGWSAVHDQLPGTARTPRPAAGAGSRRAGSPPVRILIGNVDTNAELAELYHALCVPVDRVFPGPGGAYLRTFTDPWGDGIDAVIIGVSTDADLSPAVEALAGELIIEDGLVAVPRQHRVTIAADFRRRHPQLSPDPEPAAFRAAAVQAYRTRAHRGMTPYLNHLALMYQLTGDPEFTRRYLEIFTDMVAETSAWEPDQWGRWGFDADFAAVGMIAGWQAIRDSPTFCAEDRRNIVAHLLAYLGNSEEQWVMHRATASHPARHNHFTFAALGLLFGATMIARTYDPERAERWLAMADECFAPQLTATKPTEDCDSYGWLTLAHTLRYALVRPSPGYVDEGWCAATLARGITAMDNLGHQVPHGDASRYDGNYAELGYWAPAAWLLQDSAAQSLVARKLASMPESPALGIMPIGHDYGASAWARDDSLFELERLDVQPLDDAFVASLKPTAPADGFDKLALRDGIDEADRYLLIDGVGVGGHGHVDAGAIVRLTSRGRIWLEDADYDKISANFHNTVLIFRDGETSARPPYASLRWQHQDEHASIAVVSLPGLSGCDWTRAVILLPGLGFVVADTITALRAGEIETHGLWRTVGRTEQSDDHGPAGDHWTMIMGEERLRLITAPPAGGWRVERAAEPYRRTNWPDYPYAEPEVTVLRQVSSGALAAGESRTVVHLLADGPGDAEITRDGEVVRLTVDDRQLRLDLAALTSADGPRVITSDQATASRTKGVRSLSLSKRRPEPVEGGRPDHPGPLRQAQDDASTSSGNEHSSVPIGWQFDHDGTTAGLVTDLAGDGSDRLLLGAPEGVSCYQGDRLRWRCVTEAPVTAIGRGGGPDGTGIIVGQADGRLSVIDTDGKPLWRQTFPPHMGHPATVRAAFSARLDAAGPPSVIIATESCHVEAFTADGDFRWRYEVVHAASTAGAADLDGDGLDEVIAATEYWTWHAVKADGSALFKTRGVESSGASVVAAVTDPDGAGRLAVFGGWDGHLTAYRADGARAWDRSFGDVITSMINSADDLVIGTRAGQLLGVAADGTVRWRRDLGAAVITLTRAGDLIIVVAGEVIHMLDPDGTPRHTFGWPDPPVEVAACRLDGRTGLYLRDTAGRHSWLSVPAQHRGAAASRTS